MRTRQGADRPGDEGAAPRRGAGDARPGAADLRRPLGQAVGGELDGLAPKVFVSMMSAPART